MQKLAASDTRARCEHDAVDAPFVLRCSQCCEISLENSCFFVVELLYIFLPEIYNDLLCESSIDLDITYALYIEIYVHLVLMFC